MTGGSPPPEEQVRFLQNLQRILSEGSFVASYKFALLHALADIAVLNGEDSGAALAVRTSDIAERFISLYWRQAVPYPGTPGLLKQNTGRQASVLRLVSEAHADAGGSLPRFRQDAPAWTRLVKAVERVVKAQPLWKLQTVGDERLEFLYENSGGNDKTITLRPGVAYCLRSFHGLITELVRAGWLRYVRRRNASNLGEATDLPAFLFGSERADLSQHATILREVQDGDCFYCKSPLGTSGEVDHFIPWARYPLDLGHNFVLAHGSCNNAKSDALAAVCHLERWCQRNSDFGPALEEAFDRHDILHDLASSLNVTSWSYSQAEASDAKLWMAKKAELVPINQEWRRLYGAAMRDYRAAQS